MTTIGEAYVEIRPDTKRFEGDIEHGVGGAFKKVAAIAAAAFAGLKTAEFLKGSITAASDLNESMSKVNVVFGDSAGAVKDFAKTAAESLGQSQNQALAAAGTFGNLFTALKITEKDSAAMSTSLVTLAGDLASFNNVSPDEALQALRSGLVGETEPLKRFGVNLNEATLKAKALELGLISNTKGALDPAAKAQASYALIMEQTAKAQGDFARTSDGLANRQRIMAARFEDMKTKVGSFLLPVMLKLYDLVDLVGGRLGDLGAAIARVVKGPFETLRLGVLALGAAFSGEGVTSGGFVGFMERVGVVLMIARDQLKLFINALRTGFTENEGTKIESVALAIRNVALRIADVVKIVARFIKENPAPVFAAMGAVILLKVVPAFIAWAKAARLAAIAQYSAHAPAIALAVAIAALVGGLVYAYQHFESFRNIVNSVSSAILGYVKDIWPQITEAIRHVINATVDIIKVGVEIIQFIWRHFGDDILQYLGGVFSGIAAVAQAGLEIIKGIIQFWLAIINGEWGKAWDALKSIVGGFVDGVLGILSGLWASITAVFGAGYEAAIIAWQALWVAFKAVVTEIIDSILGAIQKVFDKIQEAIDAAKKLVGGGDVGLGDLKREAGRGGLGGPGFPSGGGTAGGAAGAAKGGLTQNINISATGVDAHDLSAKLSREIAWRSRTAAI